MLPEHLELIRKAAEEHGVRRYNVEHELDSEKNVNYLASIVPITVKATEGSDAVKLILKIAPADEAARQKRAILEAFETEFEFYSNVLPELLKFQDSYSLTNPFSGTPKCYGSTLERGKEAILMNNLSSEGYKTRPPIEPMPFDHMALVLKEYAKFHAISLALRHKNPVKFEEVTRNLKQTFLERREAQNLEHYQNMRRVVLDMGRKAVQGHAKAERAHRKFAEVLEDFWRESRNNPENNVVVVGHGDCHANNILFKYDVSNVNMTPVICQSPKQVCLIDWQLSSTTSPIRDVSFALCACASKEALCRAEELFEIYYDAVKENLKEFDCDPNEIFSYDEFLRQWQKHFLHGLYRAQATLKLTVMTQQEIDELGQSATSILDIFRRDFAPRSPFAQRMKDLFEVVGDKWLY